MLRNEAPLRRHAARRRGGHWRRRKKCAALLRRLLKLLASLLARMRLLIAVLLPFPVQLHRRHAVVLRLPLPGRRRGARSRRRRAGRQVCRGACATVLIAAADLLRGFLPSALR